MDQFLQGLEPYSRPLAGAIFLIVGVLALVRRRVQLEETDYVVTGRVAQFLGLIACAIGVYLLVIK